MADLRSILAHYSSVDGVSAAAVVDPDGLVIEGDLGDAFDMETLGMVASNTAALTRAIGHEVQKGEALQTILEFEQGTVMLEPIGDQATLLVVCDSTGSLGKLRFVAKRHRGELDEIISTL
jgi:uncharacterized protein